MFGVVVFIVYEIMTVYISTCRAAPAPARAPVPARAPQTAPVQHASSVPAPAAPQQPSLMGQMAATAGGVAVVSLYIYMCV